MPRARLELIDIRDRLASPEARELVDALGYPVAIRREKTNRILAAYREHPEWPLLGALTGHALANRTLMGFIGLRLAAPGAAEIRHIAVRQELRRRGIGRQMVEAACRRHALRTMYSETDGDAAGFYRKAGFSVERIASKYPNVERFGCTLRVTVHKE